MSMLPDPKIKCPATGFARSCREIIAECDCPKFVSLRGKDPQTGADIEAWGCVDSFLPKLLIENAQMARQTAAAVESFRNEVVKANEDAMAERRQALVDFAKLGGPRLVPPLHTKFNEEQ